MTLERRYDWFVADNAAVPHSGVVDMDTLDVVEVRENDDGTWAQARARDMNAEWGRRVQW